MDTKLPEGWVEVTLGEIAEWGSGGTPSRTMPHYYGGDIPWIKTGDLNDSLLEEVEEYISEEGLKKSSAKIFPKGSVAVAMYGATIGKTALLGIDAATNQASAVAQPYTGIDKKYLFYYIQSQKQNFIDKGKGGAQPNISQMVIKMHPFPLAPYQEQKRIADKLDNLYHHLDSLNERLDKIPVLLKRFREHVLMQAVTGKLTEAWRNNRNLITEFDSGDEEEMREVNISLPDSWKWLPFSSIASVDSNLVEPSKFLDYPLIAPDNIQSETGRLIDKPTVSEIMPKSAKHYFEKGSIVYSKIRPYLSKVIVADFAGLCSADMYPISTKLNTRYLYYYMLSKTFLSYATSAGERSVLPKINQKELSIIPISVPSLVEQNEVVRRIDTLFKSFERLETLYVNVKTKINNLPPNILAKAFKGELVDADPKDEPASKLLERILQGQTPIKEKPQDNPRLVQSNTKKVQHKHIPMTEISLLTIIEEEFSDRDFSFEELKDSLQQLSKSDYVQLKKQFFELLRNDKYKRKADRITTTIDIPSGTMRYKLQKHETIKA